MLAAGFDFKLEHEVKGNLVTIAKCKLPRMIAKFYLFS